MTQGAKTTLGAAWITEVIVSLIQINKLSLWVVFEPKLLTPRLHTQHGKWFCPQQDHQLPVSPSKSFWHHQTTWDCCMLSTEHKCPWQWSSWLLEGHQETPPLMPFAKLTWPFRHWYWSCWIKMSAIPPPCVWHLKPLIRCFLLGSESKCKSFVWQTSILLGQMGCWAACCEAWGSGFLWSHWQPITWFIVIVISCDIINHQIIFCLSWFLNRAFIPSNLLRQQSVDSGMAPHWPHDPIACLTVSPLLTMTFTDFVVFSMKLL